MNSNSNNELNGDNYSNNMETAVFAFKIAYTEQRATFIVPVDICIANFIEHIKYEAYNTFNIDRNLDLEIVEAGQGTREIRGEDAPALHLDFDTTLRQKYNGIYEARAFYIRIIQ